MNWLAFELIESLSHEERKDFLCLNSALYSVAAVMSFREGEEFTINEAKQPEKKEEPMWKKRIDKKIIDLRREADILKAASEGKIKQEKAKQYLGYVIQKHRIDGSRAAITKTLFLVKGKISTLGCKIRRYEKQR